MMGGEAHGVDYFFREQIPAASALIAERELVVPSLMDDKHSTIYTGHPEAVAFADCLDHLPWSRSFGPSTEA